jgi:hypothetical protein
MKRQLTKLRARVADFVALSLKTIPNLPATHAFTTGLPAVRALHGPVPIATPVVSRGANGMRRRPKGDRVKLVLVRKLGILA